MKVLRMVIILVAVALVLGSCASLAEGVLSDALHASISGGGSSGGSGNSSSNTSSGSSGTTASASSAVVDFRSGEILCSADSGPMMESTYYTAKVLTQASAATKNQAEAVFINNGQKSWVNFVVNSRKAVKSDFTVGATVFFLTGWQSYDEMDADRYRQEPWRLGNITSTDDLYKSRVEVAGNSFNINLLRVPTDPIK